MVARKQAIAGNFPKKSSGDSSVYLEPVPPVRVSEYRFVHHRICTQKPVGLKIGSFEILSAILDRIGFVISGEVPGAGHIMSAYVPYAVITGDKLVSPRDNGDANCPRSSGGTSRL